MASIMLQYYMVNPLPIYHPKGGFYESLDYLEVRKKPNPSWQNSIRKLSVNAFNTILTDAGMDKDYGYLSSLIEKSETSPIAQLKKLNEKYKNFSPSEKSKAVDKHIDRGNSVTNALKKLLGAQCKICGWIGFKGNGKDKYIEAHHLTQISIGKKNSLCSDNIILLCPDCHREIHNGSDTKIFDFGDYVQIKLSSSSAKIRKNTTLYLEKLVWNQIEQVINGRKIY